MQHKEWTDKVQGGIQLPQTVARRGEKNFLEPAPPPPPPPLSQGMDPALR